MQAGAAGKRWVYLETEEEFNTTADLGEFLGVTDSTLYTAKNRAGQYISAEGKTYAPITK